MAWTHVGGGGGGGAMTKKGRNAITFSERKPRLTGKVYENAFYFAK